LGRTTTALPCMQCNAMAPSPVVRLHGRDRSADRDAMRPRWSLPPRSVECRPPGMHVICYEPPTTATERCVSGRWLSCKLMRDFSLCCSLKLSRQIYQAINNNFPS
jgi:hypothetical protein